LSDDNWILKTIQPKSDQLNADDLVSGPATVTVSAVKRGSEDQPVCIELAGYDGRPYKPCKSMRRVLIALWGERPSEWIGRRMTLYCDPEVKWGGVRAGGIRISHLSHIEKPTVILLTATRGKRVEFQVSPLAAEASMLDRAKSAISGATTIDRLKQIEDGIRKQKFTPDELVDLIELMDVRRKEIE